MLYPANLFVQEPCDFLLEVLADGPGEPFLVVPVVSVDVTQCRTRTEKSTVGDGLIISRFSISIRAW